MPQEASVVAGSRQEDSPLAVDNRAADNRAAEDNPREAAAQVAPPVAARTEDTAAAAVAVHSQAQVLAPQRTPKAS